MNTNENQTKEATKLEVIIAVVLVVFSICFGIYNGIKHEGNMINQSSHTINDNGLKRYIKNDTLDLSNGCAHYIETDTNIERIYCNPSLRRINK